MFPPSDEAAMDFRSKFPYINTRVVRCEYPSKEQNRRLRAADSIDDIVDEFKHSHLAALRPADEITKRPRRLFTRPRKQHDLARILSQPTDKLIESIREGVIGDGCRFKGPFGHRRITYADYTASGRSLSFIEHFLRNEVMPLYANTHSEVSLTGRQTNRYREAARGMIRDAVKAGPDDVVIVLGSGSTAAINRMVDVLGLRANTTWKEGRILREQIPERERPVVFIGPYEHHSNELPWRESIADVVVIGADREGHISQAQLRWKLREYRARPLRIGSFSAASNVTGILSDTDAITSILHQHGALAFWDYAAAGPYVDINMNPDQLSSSTLRSKDAIFLSPHKFVGGPGTPGILVAKKKLFRSKVACNPGGGTVNFVTPEMHSYLSDIEHREEGGTPAIIESIRAGLVFHLKEKVGVSNIERREEAFVAKAMEQWGSHPHIKILGSRDAHRLAIVSFLVTDSHGNNFHHNFIVALLNDLFGIQARGGCSCAGPYGHHLLGVDAATSMQYTDAIAAGYEGIKPGWVRVNFSYFLSEVAFGFLLDAVEFLADHAGAFLRQYRLDVHTGSWRHVDEAPPAISLMDAIYSDKKAAGKKVSESAFARYLAEAKRLVSLAEAEAEAEATMNPGVRSSFPPQIEAIRWFPV